MSDPRSWTVRPEQPADIGQIHRVTAAAFGREDEADLVDALRGDECWIDGLSMVAVEPNGPVVGHALLTRCHVGEVEALCLAPCSVLPTHQGRGVGSAVIRAVLDAARRQGERFVVVLGHPHYYPRFGFEPASVSGVNLTIPVPEDALMTLSLDPSGSMPAGTVRYAAPFGIDDAEDGTASSSDSS